MTFNRQVSASTDRYAGGSERDDHTFVANQRPDTWMANVVGKRYQTGFVHSIIAAERPDAELTDDCYDPDSSIDFVVASVIVFQLRVPSCISAVEDELGVVAYVPASLLTL